MCRSTVKYVDRSGVAGGPIHDFQRQIGGHNRRVNRHWQGNRARLCQGWVQVLEDGALITLRGKTGWREVEIGRGSSEQTCPVHALAQWLHFAKIDFGPIFVAISRDGRKATPDRLSDKHVARLIKHCVEDAGLRPELSKAERNRLYSGHSLRAGLASSAEVDERFVQKQLGHASAEMTRRYQRRRDRFRVNLTKAAGL
jgi:integrase